MGLRRFFLVLMKRAVQFFAIIAAVTITVLVGWYILPHGDKVLRNRALHRRQLALEVLGAYLGERMAGARTLVVGNPFTQVRGQSREVYSYEEAALRGLRRGARGKLVLLGVEYPELVPAAIHDPSSVPVPPDATTPLSFMCSEGSWDRLVSRHRDVSLLVSLIGIPADVQRLGIWRKPEPKFAFLLPDFRVLGDEETVIAAFRSGKIVAAVVNHPNTPPESEKLARRTIDEFSRRFILVTVDNCDVVVRAVMVR